MQHESISFDENDQNLFQVDDAPLRADALRHSILPRLHVVMNKCISMISEVYGVEALDDSIVTFYPHFRQKREKELSIFYEAAHVGLGGKRVKNKWLGVERKNGKPVQIVPFRFGFELTQDGLSLVFENYWLKGLSNASFAKYLNFHLEFESLTHRLCYLCGMEPYLFYGDDVKLISPFKRHYQYMIERKIFDNSFVSQHCRDFPVLPKSIDLLIENYVFFYPIYDSYLRISKDQPVRLLELIEKANNWLISREKSKGMSYEAHNSCSQELISRAKQAAEKKVKVMPSIRWQVFKRDDWKCVSCGKGSPHGVVLHVDHIIPRSKGGQNTLENYQTLCSLCNIGKSNRDDTDLRARLL